MSSILALAIASASSDPVPTTITGTSTNALVSATVPRTAQTSRSAAKSTYLSGTKEAASAYACPKPAAQVTLGILITALANASSASVHQAKFSTPLPASVWRVNLLSARKARNSSNLPAAVNAFKEAARMDSTLTQTIALVSAHRLSAAKGPSSTLEYATVSARLQLEDVRKTNSGFLHNAVAIAIQLQYLAKKDTTLTKSLARVSVLLSLALPAKFGTALIASASAALESARTTSTGTQTSVNAAAHQHNALKAFTGAKIIADANVSIKSALTTRSITNSSTKKSVLAVASLLLCRAPNRALTSSTTLNYALAFAHRSCAMKDSSGVKMNADASVFPEYAL